MKPRALVIDDDPEARRIVGDILDSLNHDHDEAEDQEEARALLKPGKYSYVLLDLQIPVKPSGLCRIENGVNILREIREGEGTSALPVIVMTGYGKEGPELATYVFKCGATDYVTKPLDMGKLDRAIQEALGKAAAGQGNGAPRKAVPFKAAKREMVLHEDRVTVCGLEVWKDCAQPDLRKALVFLARRDDHGFVRIRGSELDRRLGRTASNPIARRIKEFRDRASEVLQEKGLECGPSDIVASGRGGYHLPDWITVRVAGSRVQNEPARAHREPPREPGREPREPANEPAREPDEPGNEPGEPGREPALNGRQEWILAEIRKGVRLRHGDIVREKGVNRSTVNRDLKVLRDRRLVRLHAEGYYVLVEPARRKALASTGSR